MTNLTHDEKKMNASEGPIEKTKILYLCRVGREIGGAQNQFLYVLKKLDRERYTPYVIVPRVGYLYDQLNELGISTSIIRYYQKKTGLNLNVIDFAKSIFNLWAKFRMQRITKRIKPDIVHGDCDDIYYLRKIHNICDVPILCHVRGNEVFSAELSDVGFIRKFISISHRLKAPLLKAGISEEKIQIINDGLDFSKFDLAQSVSDTPKILSESPTSMRVGVIGRIEPRKRIIECLKIASECKKSNLNVEFFFAGLSLDAKYHREVMKYHKSLGLEDTCFFVGEQKDIRQFLVSIDVLMTLSGGSVMLEAMAMARPVIAAAPPSPPGQSIVKHGKTGFLLESDDLKGVFDALNRIVDDPQLQQQFGQEGRRKVLETFDVDFLNRKLFEVYDHCR